MYIGMRKFLETTLNTGFWKNDGDPLRFSAPEENGLYLVGSTHFNPFTKEEFYLVKVGTSKNLNKRMKQYKGTNPLMFHIDYYPTNNTLPLYECDCHMVLYENCEGIIEGCDEWVKVSRDTYLEICEKKFNYFLEKRA